MNITLSPRGVQVGMQPTAANLLKFAAGFAALALVVAAFTKK